mmetsp:Transcript_7085/g.10857  ORF Transcript_7085/g.10857 Transcript_7085/m.10857 type:complete len:99 (-) Transcript_7085:179-475(-)
MPVAYKGLERLGYLSARTEPFKQTKIEATLLRTDGDGERAVYGMVALPPTARTTAAWECHFWAPYCLTLAEPMMVYIFLLRETRKHAFLNEPIFNDML